MRVPAAFFGLLLLVWFPLISGRVDARYRSVARSSADGFLARWLLITAALFGGSALLLAVRSLWSPRSLWSQRSPRSATKRRPPTSTERRSAGRRYPRGGAGRGCRSVPRKGAVGAGRRDDVDDLHVGAFVDVHRGRLGDQQAAGREQGGDAHEQGTGSPPMPTLPSMRRTVPHRPSPGRGSKTERRSDWPPSRRVRATAASLTSMPRTVRPRAASSRHQPAGAAAHVEHGTLAPVQHLQVDRVGPRHQRLDLQRQQPAVHPAQEQRTARRRAGRRSRVEAAQGPGAVPRAAGTPGRPGVADRPAARLPARSSCSSARPSSGRLSVRTRPAGRRTGRAGPVRPPPTRRRGVDVAQARQVAHPQPRREEPRPLHGPVTGVDMGTPRSSAGSGRTRPRAQKPPSSAGPTYASQPVEVHGEQLRRHLWVSIPISRAGPAHPAKASASRSSRPPAHCGTTSMPGGSQGRGRRPAPAPGAAAGVAATARRVSARAASASAAAWTGVKGGVSRVLTRPGRGFLGDDEEGWSRAAHLGLSARAGPAGRRLGQDARVASRTACQVPRQVPVTFEAPVRGR